MEMVLLNADEVQELAVQQAGSPPNGVAALGELLRAELSALRISTRRSLADRVRSRLLAVADVPVEAVREVIEALEDIGDVTSGPGGYVAAAPLRAVRAGAERYLLRGSLPTRYLATALQVTPLVESLGRSVRVEHGSAGDFETRVVAMQGVVLSAGRWSGLERAPVADAIWLAELQRRQAATHRPPSVDSDSVGQWRVYAPEASSATQGKRWQAEAEQGSLWRAWATGGWPVFVWTSGARPGSSEDLRFTGDEACRTMFALDRQAQAPLLASWLESGTTTELRFPGRLPATEFRYLTTLGDYLGTDHGIARFRIPAEEKGALANLLTERLGVAHTTEEHGG